jgi:rhamnosyltransferase subunit B
MRIILTTIGSLGDLHPFIALGQALAERGAHPVLATPETHVAKCRKAGLEAHAVTPDFYAMAMERGLDPDVAIRRAMQSPDFIMREVILPYLEHSAEALDALANGAAAMVGSSFSLAGAIVAEARGLPYIPALLQPMMLLSAHDPPHTPEMRLMAGAPVGVAGLAWNRMGVRLIRAEMLRRYGGPINQLRRRRGLQSSRAAPLFDWPVQPPLQLALYSPELAPLPPDAPAGAQITGFPWFDSDSGAPETLDAPLQAFLDAGDPPLVFTLGSFAVHAPGAFYSESLAAARAVGRRAILLLGPDGQPPAGMADDAICATYAPHSLVFPRAAAIIHHGGVGTTGQAMRAGRPQLVVPHMADQPDHAARLVRRGIARALPARRYRRDAAAAALGHLLRDADVAARAREVGRTVAAEAGAARAADAVMEVLARR